MILPPAVPVMTLPGATLFPRALLPLYIFEPRYRKMLAHMLESERMFSVAMQRPGRTRETPCQVAGLGLIRVSVGHEDGTSHLVMQGLTRVTLGETVQSKPYRVQRILQVETSHPDTVAVDALQAKILELVRRRLELGDLPFPMPLFPSGSGAATSKKFAGKSVTMDGLIHYLETLPDAEAMADMVACALLGSPMERQVILETPDLEQRLRHLIHFLMAEINMRQKNQSS